LVSAFVAQRYAIFPRISLINAPVAGRCAIFARISLLNPSAAGRYAIFPRIYDKTLLSVEVPLSENRQLKQQKPFFS
jgi:hypothetical protein